MASVPLPRLEAFPSKVPAVPATEIHCLSVFLSIRILAKVKEGSEHVPTTEALKKKRNKGYIVYTATNMDTRRPDNQ